MSKLLLLLPVSLAALLLAASSPRAAMLQPQQSAAAEQVQDQAMQKVAFLLGHWEGAATFTAPTGQKVSVRQTEEVRSKLNGKLMLIEGIGRGGAAGEPQRIIFEALATLCYDPAARQYKMRAHGRDGLSVDPTVTTGDNALTWHFSPAPNVEIRYEIHLDDRGHWMETGKRTQDGGKSWTTFIEMDLQRKPD